ncbi:glycosyltransferase involved in cell wall biosynthesis [Bradyrhizobium sp. USDA 4448]
MLRAPACFAAHVSKGWATGTTHCSPSRIGRSTSFAQSTDRSLSQTKLSELTGSIRVANFPLFRAVKSWIESRVSITEWERLEALHAELSLRQVARAIFSSGQLCTQGTDSRTWRGTAFGEACKEAVSDVPYRWSTYAGSPFVLPKEDYISASLVGPANTFRSRVVPIIDGEPRPTWSVMIPTFNCGRFLAQALQSVLDQDPGIAQMQIEVIDDASTMDDPAEIVRRIGKGRVTFYRQPTNVGHIRNFAACLNRARGTLIHLLHGDDFVSPGFYAALERGFNTDQNVGAAFCRHAYVDPEGRFKSSSALEQVEAGCLEDGLARLAGEQRIATPSIAVRRAVYEQLGGFDERLTCSEDWEMWVRIAARYKIWYEPEALASYRMHDDSNTGRHRRLAQELEYSRQAIAMFRDYLPKPLRHAARRARNVYAGVALTTAEELLLRGDVEAVDAHLKCALRLSCSPRIVLRFCRLLAKRLGIGSEK